MTYAVIDCESTFFQKGNPFSYQNRLCLVGVRINGINEIIPIEYDPTHPYSEGLTRLGELINSVSTVVLFNAKFDLNWLARYGVFIPDTCLVFDCQLVEFILGNQRPAYPSLDWCLSKYGLGSKSDVVRTEYWEKGIDTDHIPIDILNEYLNGDLLKTDELYIRLQSEMVRESAKTNLIQLHLSDLRVLQEMEFNGQRFSWDSIADAQILASEELREIDDKIKEYVPADCRAIWNANSGDHLSILLYGGVLRGKRAMPYQRIYKTGPNAGQSISANKWENYEYIFPQLVKPIKGSELKKDGFFSTDEETLLSLSKPKALLRLLLRRAELAKLIQTYYLGLPGIRDKYDWQDGLLHGTLNQCRVITGRLSSEKPNQQNFPKELNEYIISRFN